MIINIKNHTLAFLVRNETNKESHLRKHEPWPENRDWLDYTDTKYDVQQDPSLTIDMKQIFISGDVLIALPEWSIIDFVRATRAPPEHLHLEFIDFMHIADHLERFPLLLRVYSFQLQYNVKLV